MKSKSITIKIKCDNAAFVGLDNELEYEVIGILEGFIEHIKSYDFLNCSTGNLKLKDVNGNTCGSVKLTGF